MTTDQANLDGIEVAANYLKLLSSTARLRIAFLISDEELSVSEISERLDGALSQSALSQHLTRFREAGVVQTRRASQAIYYRLASDDVQRVLETIASLGRAQN
ncbi:ArsR/SmtB family transcription factor [Kushneria indalinina]|uniref:ArsR family transcriptional regulator n=1 Tax=Kushneria indalinina DSM 14324 TaxID=1122140 RepID=A0A3D9E0T5_9GAMM|nr:metalloregulator ArsR/SmtB family transcription factor [Kushneria indalinina]REC96660.1 ArsR family transcriptional regulator [Kushneria indalinina DSM 14324]